MSRDPYSLPDNWEAYDPDGHCKYCGVHWRAFTVGWQPEDCTGECGRKWRDPDAELEQRRDDGDR